MWPRQPLKVPFQSIGVRLGLQGIKTHIGGIPTSCCSSSLCNFVFGAWWDRLSAGLSEYDIWWMRRLCIRSDQRSQKSGLSPMALSYFGWIPCLYSGLKGFKGRSYWRFSKLPVLWAKSSSRYWCASSRDLICLTNDCWAFTKSGAADFDWVSFNFHLRAQGTASIRLVEMVEHFSTRALQSFVRRSNLNWIARHLILLWKYGEKK